MLHAYYIAQSCMIDMMPAMHLDSATWRILLKIAYQVTFIAKPFKEKWQHIEGVWLVSSPQFKGGVIITL